MKDTRDIEKFLKTILPRYQSLEIFKATTQHQFGAERCRRLDEAWYQLQLGNAETFYNEIFSDLDVSLSISGLRFKLYQNYLEWLVPMLRVDATDTIVDVGCGNGVVACYLALRFAKTRIIGLDRSAAAIRCAQALAARLKIKNVEFVNVDTAQGKWPEQCGQANIILSLTGLQLPEVNSRGHEQTLLDWHKQHRETFASPALQVIADHLAPDGAYISVEGFDSIEQQLAWTTIAGQLGLGIAPAGSESIGYHDLLSSQTLSSPAIVFNRNNTVMEPSEQLSFLLSLGRDFERFLNASEGPVAEITFALINPKTFIGGWKLEYYDGSGIMHSELWEAGPFAVLYEYAPGRSADGMQKMRILPRHELEQVRADQRERLAKVSRHARVSQIADLSGSAAR